MDHAPGISIIVPVYNAGCYLQRCLAAISQSTFSNYELIVIDDASTDNSVSIAQAGNATLIYQVSHAGPSVARNIGASIARGEILIFLDADVEVHQDTVMLLWQSLHDHPEIAAVFGSYDNDPYDRHLVSTFKNLMHYYVHQTGNPDAHTFWTGCSAIRRSVFEKAGPFSLVGSTCVDDIEYGYRLRKQGYRIWLNRHIYCKHLKQWTLPLLIKTDVFQRGVPWTYMMLKQGRLDNELNLGWAHRFSALTSLATVVALFLAIVHDVRYLLIGMGCILILMLLQRPFYQLLSANRGTFFSLACVPLHILYYCYSLLALLLGTGFYVAQWVKQRVASL